MRLKKLFDKQKLFQEKLNNNYYKNQEYINIMTIAIIDELMEAIRETKWKPWKQQQQFNEENFKNELIDVWHFIINLTLASGMDANELYEKFCNKNKINHKRQKEGY